MSAKKKGGSEKLWGGRFSDGVAPSMERFSASIDIDKRLWAHDIKCSLAHARMLQEAGLITAGELKRIKAGLDRIAREIESGGFEFTDELEDIHMHIESRLIELAGDAGAKLHTARSRNDQVVTDLKLYLKDECGRLEKLLAGLELALVQKAESNMDVIIPGYTHLQRAQPVLASFHLMAYVSMLERDRDRVADCRGRLDEMPLGSAALAGTSLPIDRKRTAELLGFAAISDNAMDAVAARDFVLEMLSVLAILMTDLSRMMEDLVLWAGDEFGFVTIGDAFCTGSSIMPQKKNPDAAELIRGCASQVVGALASGLTLLKGLPMAYNRDLQWDKDILFRALDFTIECLDVGTGMIGSVEFDRERIAAEMTGDMLCATDLAEYLVEKGMPFRQAHKAVGRIVARAVDQGCQLGQLEFEVYRAASKLFERDLYSRLDAADSVSRKRSSGSTAAVEVKKHIRKIKLRLAKLL